MIGWTKKRKRCKEHGLVLRGEPGSYCREADYCPACGKQLTVISVPYLFQVYFHPAIMIVPGILMFLFGMFLVLDIRGCIIEGRKNAEIVATERQARKEKKDAEDAIVAQNLPDDWKVVYVPVHEGHINPYNLNSHTVLADFLGTLDGKKMSYLNPDEIRMFMKMMPDHLADEAFKLITTHIGEER